MRKIGFDREPLTRYEVIVENRLKRKQAIAHAQHRLEKTRSVMVNHINSVAAGQVQLSEMLLRNKVNTKA